MTLVTYGPTGRIQFRSSQARKLEKITVIHQSSLRMGLGDDMQREESIFLSRQTVTRGGLQNNFSHAMEDGRNQTHLTP